MKKVSYLLTGVLIGSMVSYGASAFANNYQTVSAYLADSISFKFDNVEKELPSGYDVLLYNDRTYVPARFVAEELGATVDWDEDSKTVLITKPVVETPELECPEEDKEDQEDKEPVKDYSNYQELPITLYHNETLVTVYGIETNDSHTRVYVTVNNTGTNPMYLEQTKTYVEIGDKVYSHEDLFTRQHNLLHMFDNSWFSDIRREETRDGLLRLPKLPEKAEYAKLYIEVRQNDGSGKVGGYEFKIKL